MVAMNQSTALPKSGMLPDDYAVPDVLASDMALVFCGTALGRKSALERAYYANPGNFFWRTLYDIGLTPRRFLPHEYAQLAALGIGLTDMCKTAFGNDDELPCGAFDRHALVKKIRKFEPEIVAFTSKTAASQYLQRSTAQMAYGMQPEQQGRTAFYVLPSPSGHARRYWQPQHWQALAEKYKQIRHK
jgi:TDG/mug DNA glycosylase family protein